MDHEEEIEFILEKQDDDNYSLEYLEENPDDVEQIYIDTLRNQIKENMPMDITEDPYSRTPEFSDEDLAEMNKEELEDVWKDIDPDQPDMYPNGRDWDAENPEID